MKKNSFCAVVFILVGFASAWAISSEPVNIKGFENVKNFESHLSKLTELLKFNKNPLGVQDPLASLIAGESAKFDAVKQGDEATRLEVTKIYRQLDATRKSAIAKGIGIDTPVIQKIGETIKFIEQLNNIKG